MDSRDNILLLVVFASGVAVGCSVTMFLGTLYKIVAIFADRNRWWKRQRGDVEGGELNISSPVLRSTSATFPIVSLRHSSAVPAQQGACPLLKEEGLLYSSSTRKERCSCVQCLRKEEGKAGKEAATPLTREEEEGFYMSPPVGTPRLYTGNLSSPTQEGHYETIPPPVPDFPDYLR